MPASPAAGRGFPGGCWQAVDLETDADGQRARRQRRQRAVEIAAIAQAIAVAVETVEWQQDQIGNQPFPAVGVGMP